VLALVDDTVSAISTLGSLRLVHDAIARLVSFTRPSTDLDHGTSTCVWGSRVPQRPAVGHYWPSPIRVPDRIRVLLNENVTSPHPLSL